ncbi:hypothetical protein JZ751_019608 [Albula glossodonta]|uniref:Uncharacterized protein n=1 Tax=Albula glossodonta TaxID=121402 RepID=A0A8T2NLR7_9TELE|nr:hypothetical protein JZ751_019608 [Albula glossodonta]
MGIWGASLGSGRETSFPSPWDIAGGSESCVLGWDRAPLPYPPIGDHTKYRSKSPTQVHDDVNPHCSRSSDL